MGKAYWEGNSEYQNQYRKEKDPEKAVKKALKLCPKYKFNYDKRDCKQGIEDAYFLGIGED